jgi:hypothetical protein
VSTTERFSTAEVALAYRQRHMRARVLTEDEVFSRVFAEVIAWQQVFATLFSKEREHANAITDLIYDDVKTGMTESQRLGRIRKAVNNYMEALPV